MNFGSSEKGFILHADPMWAPRSLANYFEGVGRTPLGNPRNAAEDLRIAESSLPAPEQI